MRDTTLRNTTVRNTPIASGARFSLRVRLALAALLFVTAVAVMTVALSGPANAVPSAPKQNVATVVWAEDAAEPATAPVSSAFDGSSTFDGTTNGLLDSPALVLVLALVAAFAAVMAWRCAGPTTSRAVRAER